MIVPAGVPDARAVADDATLLDAHHPGGDGVAGEVDGVGERCCVGRTDSQRSTSPPVTVRTLLRVVPWS